MTKNSKKIYASILMLLVLNVVTAQTKKPVATIWDGMAIAGYVNDGAFVNFGGPTIKLIKKPWIFGFGILPTMRIKEDKVAAGAKKNSIVTPTAGFGFTFLYKHFVTQVPFYYNAKSTTVDGKWNVGVGIGYKF